MVVIPSLPRHALPAPAISHVINVTKSPRTRHVIGLVGNGVSSANETGSSSGVTLASFWERLPARIGSFRNSRPQCFSDSYRACGDSQAVLIAEMLFRGANIAKSVNYNTDFYRNFCLKVAEIDDLFGLSQFFMQISRLQTIESYKRRYFDKITIRVTCLYSALIKAQFSIANFLSPVIETQTMSLFTLKRRKFHNFKNCLKQFLFLSCNYTVWESVSNMLEFRVKSNL
ncbi:hypothetical protein TcasGA2_TC011995 [Tribolium castaneum]|uniref:Uncharacterized protein n=1 Tax=Tribolium castaneum TaxID=7070 RepID=D6X2P1_TRICA|nr:hypothetical protein TcasGA2_TC011995 [Tribolium castaneum]